MTTTYDPHDAAYLDEADVRHEMARVFDVCQECRRCADLCVAFPTLFGILDGIDDRDAGRMTPAEQDRVVAACYQCKLCHVTCPYTPALHELAIDFPRLVLRAEAMRRERGHQPVRQQIGDRVMARPDATGRRSGATASVVDRIAGAPPGSLVRRLLAVTTGVSAVRLLPPIAKQRFSTWMARRTAGADAGRRGRVVVFPSCRVEYHDVETGKDLVAVFEHNGIACTATGACCCGAPWLHAGDAARFTAVANANVRTLAAEIRAGGAAVVVPEPSCGYVLRHDYVVHCDPDHRADAELVAAHTRDAAEHLLRLHAATDEHGDGHAEGGVGGAAAGLRTDFTGEVAEQVTYHAPCLLRAQDVGLAARDLLELTGARVEVVQECAGIGTTWGLRAGNEHLSVPIAARLAERIDLAGAGRVGVVAGDCSWANAAIAEQTGVAPAHPLSILARAYGIPAEPG
jgi:glycerol-3-phosphate dehydrogenase subunit C